MRKSKYEGKFNKGDKFGEWVILSPQIISHEKTKEAMILCQCSCGSEDKIRCLSLIKKQSTKCFNCGHSFTGDKHHLFKGYKEIPGSWFIRYTNRRNKWEFNITIEEIYDMWLSQNKKCALSQIPIDFVNINEGNDRQGSKYDLICTVSLDRIDSSKGYISDNIQLVHKDINMMKKEYNQEYFIGMCKLIAKYN
jgi:hypothetical protein